MILNNTLTQETLESRLAQNPLIFLLHNYPSFCYVQNGSWHIFREECQDHNVVKHSHVSKDYPQLTIHRLDSRACQHPYNTGDHGDKAAIYVCVFCCLITILR